MQYFYLYVLMMAGLQTLLALNVSRVRIAERRGLGEGSVGVKKAIRAHMNAVEHGLPFGFVLFALAQLQISGSVILGLGLAFMLFRVGHAIAMLATIHQLRRVSATGFYIVEFVGLIWLVKALIHVF